jgi:hypothetical protein
VLVTDGEKQQFVSALRGVTDVQSHPATVHVQGNPSRSRYGDILDGKK